MLLLRTILAADQRRDVRVRADVAGMRCRETETGLAGPGCAPCPPPGAGVHLAMNNLTHCGCIKPRRGELLERCCKCGRTIDARGCSYLLPGCGKESNGRGDRERFASRPATKNYLPLDAEV